MSEDNKIQIRFDGPPTPGPESGRFVEVEDQNGKGVRRGTWIRDGEYWLLVMSDPVDLEKKLADAREMIDAAKIGFHYLEPDGPNAEQRFMEMPKEFREKFWKQVGMLMPWRGWARLHESGTFQKEALKLTEIIDQIEGVEYSEFT